MVVLAIIGGVLVLGIVLAVIYDWRAKPGLAGPPRRTAAAPR